MLVYAQVFSCYAFSVEENSRGISYQGTPLIVVETRVCVQAFECYAFRIEESRRGIAFRGSLLIVAKMRVKCPLCPIFTKMRVVLKDVSVTSAITGNAIYSKTVIQNRKRKLPTAT